jgi:hypothetical protein
MQQPMEVTYAEVEAVDHGVSALSWPAIFGGALAAAGVSLILLTLGAGLGFSSLSAWGMGPSAATFGLSAAIWLIVVQWLSSAFGGYLAGRTRARWNALHTDESTFRDTAHGVLSWALATVIAIGLVTAGAAAIAGGGLRAAATIGAGGAQGMAQAAGPAGPGGDAMGLFTDRLFRAEQPVAIAPEIRAEGGRILMAEMRDGNLSDADKAYLAQLVANATNMTPADAAKRVDEVGQQVADAQAKLREAAEVARKAAARAAFFTAFSLLIGAFIAGAAGALGGVHREHHARLLRRTIA